MEIASTLLTDPHYTVRLYDPKAMDNARQALKGLPGAVWCGSAQETMTGADAVVIATEWTEFSALDFAELKAALRQPVLFDLRNVYRKADAEAAGLEYHGTGVAPTQRSAGA